MAEYRGLEFLDFLVHLVRWKKFLISFGVILLIVTYLLIYFLIPEQFDSTSLLVSVEETSLSPTGLISKTITNIPLASLGIGGLTATEKYDLFNTLIYSRTMLVKLIEKFDLMKDYRLDRMDKTVKTLSNNITTEITESNAFQITVRASSAQKSADMNNYLVDEINKGVIELNTKKSHDNRIFIENRYNEIKLNLKIAEDSLKNFQQKYNLLAAEDQTKATIDAYTKLETELAKKEIELSVYEKLFGENQPQTISARISFEEFKKYLEDLKNSKGNDNLIMPITSLPRNAMQYFRIYREVQINNAMLEYIIPVFEKAKYDEIKDIPVLQIIDKAVPPERKSFPPRVLLSVIITFIILILASSLLFIKESIMKSENSKIVFIKNEIINFRSKK